MWPEDLYDILGEEPRWNVGNCKRCVNRSNCGNKNKKEASWCERYRPEIKNKRKKKKR